MNQAATQLSGCFVLLGGVCFLGYLASYDILAAIVLGIILGLITLFVAAFS